MNVKTFHVQMEELVLMATIPILASVLAILMVQPVVIVLHGTMDLCVKYLKA